MSSDHFRDPSSLGISPHVLLHIISDVDGYRIGRIHRYVADGCDAFRPMGDERRSHLCAVVPQALRRSGRVTV